VIWRLSYLRGLWELIIFVRDFGINVHIRTFDTNIPHPDAKMALLYMPNQKWVTVHISGPILACLFADSGLDVLVVWDWRTGEIIGVRAFVYR
jgi:hypothetical protein